jgi:hypothetical protein
MRALLLALSLGSALLAPAQQPAQPSTASPPPAGSNWQHVQALPAGTSIYVKAGGSTKQCSLTSVDADNLTCTRGKPTTFQRTAIKSIKVPRRTLSTLILAGAGAGLGVIVVKGVDATVFRSFDGGRVKGSVYAGGAGIGAVLFGTIGFFTDAARSTVFKAP